jgi:transposase
MNTNAAVIGLDIAKNVFVAVGMDGHGKVVFKKKLARGEVLAFFANVPKTAIGIEACAGAHYWAREIGKHGHDVKLIAAQHVKSFVTGNKNDIRDAQAIAEIRARASTKYVSINTEANQDLQMLHRARQGLMLERRALICRLRAFAHEYGKVFPAGVAKFHQGFRAWLGQADHGLSGMAFETLRELFDELNAKDARLTGYDQRLEQAAREDARAKRLMAVPGIGRLTATAIVAAVADPHHFGSGRDMSANVGLIPHQHSSGGKERLLGISKRGDAYLRTLLIHGARSALRAAGEKPDRLLRWAVGLQKRKGTNVAAVALANKMVRVAWALLAHDRDYVPAYAGAGA